MFRKSLFFSSLLGAFLFLGQGDSSFSKEPIKFEKEEFVNVMGGKYSIPNPDDYKALVFVFIGYDCPISNGYAQEITRITDKYSAKKVAFCLVYADSDLKLEDARKHAKEYGFDCPVILDPKMTLARKIEASVKPECAVISPKGEVLYKGRIDNRYIDFGKRREQVTSPDLRDAIESVLAGKAVATPRTKAIGCDIDFPTTPK